MATDSDYNAYQQGYEHAIKDAQRWLEARLTDIFGYPSTIDKDDVAAFGVAMAYKKNKAATEYWRSQVKDKGYGKEKDCH